MSASNVRSQAEENVRSMAAKDPNFRKELLSDPNGTLAKLFGGKLPDGVSVKVHEESPNEIHVVVPAAGGGAQASDGGAAQPHAYCSHPGGGSWSSCGYELTCYGPTCNSN
jgi:hypothetical protein